MMTNGGQWPQTADMC